MKKETAQSLCSQALYYKVRDRRISIFIWASKPVVHFTTDCSVVMVVMAVVVVVVVGVMIYMYLNKINCTRNILCAI